MTGSEKNKPLVVVVCGPTAVGKTAFSIELANVFNCPILSFDSRQFYREMKIGTAKPNESELSQANHHFIDNRSIFDPVYTAGMFESDALKELNTIFSKHNICIAVGGSGLYIDSLCYGIDDIPKDESIRIRLQHQLDTIGIESLQDKLLEIDPEYYNSADIKNPRRIMRAIEAFEITGIPYSQQLLKQKKERPFLTYWVGLEMEREELFNRINMRVDTMIQEGLLNEAETLYPYRDLKALKTVGYSELFSYIDGTISLEQAIHDIKRNTRVYAKKQIGWFRKNLEVNWFKNSDIKTAVLDITELLSK